MSKAHIGNDGETWNEVIGRNSPLDLNLSGVVSLDLCASYGSAIVNKMFENKVSYKCTWYHSTRAVRSMIDFDFVVMSSDLWPDVSAMFKANISKVVVRSCDQKVTSACCDPLVNISSEGNSSIDDHNFVTETVGVGQNVTLTCTRQRSLHEHTLHWIRLVSGKYPEFLGGTFSFDYNDVNKTPHITAIQGPGTFILQIHETQLSDSGFYYCIKVNQLDTEFMNTTFLKIKESEPDIIDIIQVPPSDPEHPGDPVTLQCSVLSDSEKKTCPEQQHRVFWFRAGSDESHPSFIYADGNSQDECETNPEAQSPQKCVYNFSKTITSSDAGTYYCAVATCGQILFGNGAKSGNEALNMQDFKTDNTVLFLVSAALATSLIVIAFLIYFIKTKTCDFCNDAAAASGHQERPQRNEDSLFYSAPTFNKRKAERRNAKSAQEETIYTDVNASARK
ncbi:uncharacterized protein LOC127535819 [Acanthochromis polyacanthus]|uniref:uncharacterized protein LOC127535819 n=1 Tax=Acanthochromis polyacanthus TaxID=80966 RepID=UPI002234DFA9|nr:uncharacterized protein LOC127535819 [Acanthochromis polyacanthus]